MSNPQYKVNVIKEIGDDIFGYRHLMLEISEKIQHNYKLSLNPLHFSIIYSKRYQLMFEFGLFRWTVGLTFTRLP